MKKVPVILAAAALMLTANAFATEGKTKAKSNEAEAPKTEIAAEIGQMLKDHRFVLEDNQELEASVRFVVNEDNQLVVLSVRTQDDRVESYLKAKLNYQDVSEAGLEKGKTYEVPIRFTS
ncbi:hypothetical protein OZ410_08485 [Robiginitalea sp. M366]|uniref:hypothetical protein n=1 Tax=Robiginitalea aestuariiviva TaxID=3036903 RepID=UPI00240DC7F4|nr:hypothetical protein [Robiginitalea aestuariiviva]MDG1572350.1 hypothetical protein [Robiginitalea aestuariiviva]